MGIENFSENAVLVTLPEEPQVSRELITVNENISDRGGCDVIIDFSRVEILTSSSICNLMILHKLLRECGHRLIFCNVSFPTRCIFRMVGLDEFFEVVDDKFAALEGLQTVNTP